MSLMDVLTLNAKDYFDTVLDVYINFILLWTAIIICVAVFVINHHKTYTVDILKQLIRHEAYDVERAKLLSELRINHLRSTQNALSRNGQLTKIVKRADQTSISTEENTEYCKDNGVSDKIDFEKTGFYIPNECLDRAKRIIDTETPSILRASLFSFFILLFFVGIMYLMPEILTYLSDSV